MKSLFFSREWLRYKRVVKTSDDNSFRGTQSSFNDVAMQVYDCSDGNAIDKYEAIIQAAGLIRKPIAPPRISSYTQTASEYMRYFLKDGHVCTLGLQRPFTSCFQIVWVIPPKKKFV